MTVVEAKTWLVLIFFFAICLGTGAVGSFLTSEGMRDWYPRLPKPAGTPPSWLIVNEW